MTVTRIAIATYYLVIFVFLICLVTVVVKLTFWPVCTGGSACDGWTVAGLAGTILGVSAAYLGILGAIVLATWWTSLDNRVEKHVTQLFTARVQEVQDSINQLNGRAEELRAKVDAIEEMIPELQMRINIAQQSAQIALEETEPSYAQRFREHEQQRLQMNTDQKEQSPARLYSSAPESEGLTHAVPSTRACLLFGSPPSFFFYFIPASRARIIASARLATWSLLKMLET